jgi:hypothetical protein
MSKLYSSSGRQAAAKALAALQMPPAKFIFMWQQQKWKSTQKNSARDSQKEWS